MRQRVSSDTPSGRGGDTSYAIDMTSYRPQVIAHRPRDRFGRTNCLPAIDSVLPAADIIEVDLRETADGGLVAVHDAELGSVSNVSGMISELHLKEALRVHLKPLIPNVAEAPLVTIPTLAQVVARCADQAGLYLDCREVSAATLLRELAALNANIPLLVCNSNVELMVRLQNELPHIRRVTTWRSEMSGIDALPAWANEVEIFPDAISEQQVAGLRNARQRIGCLTLGDGDHEDEWQRSLALRVDWIMTDNPMAVKQFLTRDS